jgi:hypothetical protein
MEILAAEMRIHSVAAEYIACATVCTVFFYTNSLFRNAGPFGGFRDRRNMLGTRTKETDPCFREEPTGARRSIDRKMDQVPILQFSRIFPQLLDSAPRADHYCELN